MHMAHRDLEQYIVIFAGMGGTFMLFMNVYDISRLCVMNIGCVKHVLHQFEGASPESDAVGAFHGRRGRLSDSGPVVSRHERVRRQVNGEVLQISRPKCRCSFRCLGVNFNLRPNVKIEMVSNP